MKRSIIFAMLLALAAAPLSALDGFSDIFGVDGTFEAQTVPDPFDLLSNTSFSVEAFRDADDPWKSDLEAIAALDIDLSWHGDRVDARASLTLASPADSTVQWTDMLTGLSITAYFSKGRIEAGLLKKEWGSGDGVHVVDVLNSPDYRTGIVDDLNAMKNPEPMVIATAVRGNTILEGVYKPLLTPMSIASEGRWSLLPEAFAGYDDIVHSPSTSTLAYSQFGARFKTVAGPADFGVIYFNGYYDRMGYDITFTDSSAISSIDIVYTRAQLFGAEATLVAGPFTCMLEGGYWLSEDSAGTDPSRYNSKWVYLAGLGTNIPGTSAYVSITWNGHYLEEFSTGNPLDVDCMQAYAGKAYANTFTSAVEIPLARERVTVRMAGTYQMETKGFAALPSVRWAVSDAVEFTASARVFGTFEGGSDSIFKTWADNDSFKAELSCRF